MSDSCSFCGGSATELFRRAASAICQTCVEDALADFDTSDSSTLIRFDLAYGGHENVDNCRMTLTGMQLSRIVQTLTDLGIIAGVQALSTDPRLRATADFSPDSDRVVSEARVRASLAVQLDEAAILAMVRRLGEVQVHQLREFMQLASFHGGFTIRNAN
jgi:hypothetical protein